MNGKIMRNLGVVGSIIGVIISIFGLVKYNNAKSMYNASSWFGETDSSQIWGGHMQNYKICVIIGGIILVVFVILTIVGIINSKDKYSNSLTLSDSQRDISISNKMKELKIMLDNGLISQEEFDTKKKEMLDKM